MKIARRRRSRERRRRLEAGGFHGDGAVLLLERAFHHRELGVDRQVAVGFEQR
jgi:hypothetical protein